MGIFLGGWIDVQIEWGGDDGFVPCFVKNGKRCERSEGERDYCGMYGVNGIRCVLIGVTR